MEGAIPSVQIDKPINDKPPSIIAPIFKRDAFSLMKKKYLRPSDFRFSKYFDKYLGIFLSSLLGSSILSLKENKSSNFFLFIFNFDAFKSL